MIKTYLVPITDEVIKAMEKGEAPSFLHCATCLDGLTNGEVIQKMLPDATVEQVRSTFFDKEVLRVTKNGNFIVCDLDWWNSKWGEQA